MTPDEQRLINDYFDAWIDSEAEQAANGAKGHSPAPNAAELGKVFDRAIDSIDALQAVWPTTAEAPADSANFADEASPSDAAKDAPAQRFGRFEILRLLGRGGMGTVFLAFDPQIGRQVALKIPHPGGLIDEEVRERFLREARAAGALKHPQIVPVFECGSQLGCCYLVSAFCNGPTLAQWLSDRQEAVAGPMAAKLVAQLADAVQHAHDHGILHRDLKPGNVLLDNLDAAAGAGRAFAQSTSGDDDLPFVPRVTDFGLAQFTGEGATLTRTGTAIGTAAYMSPEQALGRRDLTGPRSDVFSLGAMLYELLAGQPPFGKDSGAATALAVRQSDPPPLRRQRGDIARDLEAICLKALEKQPDRRYASAAELAGDLRRYLQGEVTQARPLSPAGRVWRWARRSPATAALIMLLAITPLALAIAQTFHSNRMAAALSDAETERERAETAQHRAEAGELHARQLLYASDMMRAVGAWHDKDYATVLELLEQHAPRAGERDLRGFEWHFLEASCKPTAEAEFRHGAGIHDCAVTSSGRLVTAGADGYLRVWDLTTRRLVGALQASEKNVHAVDASPDGLWMVSGGDEVILWNLETLTRVRVLGQHPTGVETATWSPDGKLIATGARYSDVRLWSPDTGLISVIEDDGRHESLVFSADSRLLYLPQKLRLAVWDIESRKKLRTLDPNQGYGPRAMCALAGGALLACSSRFESEIVVLDAQTDAPIAHLSGDGKYSQGFAASADGRYLASAGSDGLVRLFSTSGIEAASTVRTDRGSLNRRIAAAALVHDGTTTSVAFVNANQLVTTGADGTARLWNMDRLSGWQRLGPVGNFGRISLATDDRTLLIGDADGNAPRILAGDVSSSNSTTPSILVKGIASADRHWFANVRRDGEVVVWNLKSQSVHSRLPAGPPAAEQTHARDVDFSPSGKELGIVQADGSITVWNVEESRLLRRLEGASWLLRFSSDGRHIAAGNEHGLEIWEWPSGRVIFRSGASTPYAMAWSHDDYILATAGHDQEIELWDTTKWQVTGRLVGHREAVRCLKFSPDGRTLISGDKAGDIRLWHMPTGRAMGVLFQSSSPTQTIRDVVVSRDGRLIAAATEGSKDPAIVVSSAFGETAPVVAEGN